MLAEEPSNLIPAPDELLFLPLGGTGEIGMNLTLYGHNGAWLMVDIGITFGGDDFPDHPLMVYAQRDRALAKTYRGGAYSMQPIAEHFCVSRMRVSRAVNKNEEQTSVVPDVNCET